MAAYAALISLTNTITMEQRPRYHPHRQISIVDGGLIQALLERVDLLVEFLEEIGWKGVAKDLEGRITDAAYAAEDAIERYVVDQVLPTGDAIPAENRAHILCQDLRKIIQEMDSITSEVVLFKEQNRLMKGEHGGSSRYPSLPSAPPHKDKIKMVGFADERDKLLDELMSHDSGRIVIPIVGMGGSGKTILAQNIFDDHLIRLHFNVCVWVSVSQEYSVKEILKGVLSGLNKHIKDEMDGESLGVEVHKSLFNKRYLVVLDDVWSTDVWHKMQIFFPNSCSGSRIMITTRLLTVAKEVSTSCIMMRFLDEGHSWELFCENVFPHSTCPPEFEDVGKQISRNCKGLPLAILVIGGLLARSMRRDYWEHVAEQSSHAVYLDEEEHCSKILSLSYNHLPVHLKPCFLYMGVFPEDHAISVSKLIKLWIAEGFLKPIIGKNLEETGEEYLQDLIDRTLVVVHHWGSGGEIEYCAINCFLRELCLREAQRENFLSVVMLHGLCDSPSMNCARRVVVLQGRSKRKEYPQIIDSLLSTSHHPRSLIVNTYEELSRVLGSPICRLLRVFFVVDGDYDTKDAADRECLSKVLFNLANLRYLSCRADNMFMDTLESSIGLLGNLQMLVVRNLMYSDKGPSGIWNLPQLRHVEFDMISLPDLLSGGLNQDDYIVLQNLQTLRTMMNFRFDEGIFKKLTNIKKLCVCYTAWYGEHKKWSDYSFHNLVHFEKLESFECTFFPTIQDSNDLCETLAFPLSVRKLTLSGGGLRWEYMTMIGQLPHLEVLELKNDSFIGTMWESMEGEFHRLKYLSMYNLGSLIIWNADSTHFPRLEHLVLCKLLKLEELPSLIGEIPTLRLIMLAHCSDSLVVSAKIILEEQQDYGNDELVVKVTLGRHSKLSGSSLESINFLVNGA